VSPQDLITIEIFVLEDTNFNLCFVFIGSNLAFPFILGQKSENSDKMFCAQTFLFPYNFARSTSQRLVVL